jgi:hypothetical protein
VKLVDRLHCRPSEANSCSAMTNGMGWLGYRWRRALPVVGPSSLHYRAARPGRGRWRYVCRPEPRLAVGWTEETLSRGTTGKPHRIRAVMFPDGADPARGNR